jgi:hypothetical protein
MMSHDPMLCKTAECLESIIGFFSVDKKKAYHVLQKTNVKPYQ